MTRSTFPDDRDALGAGPSMNEQLAGTLFDQAPATPRRSSPDPDLLYAPLPTPSGPSTPAHTRAMNSFNAYCTWKRSEVGGKGFGWMLTRAREKLAAGEMRIGMKALVERCREDLKLDINNTWTAWLADDLVAADARLLPLIERRIRKARR